MQYYPVIPTDSLLAYFPSSLVPRQDAWASLVGPGLDGTEKSSIAEIGFSKGGGGISGQIHELQIM
jgi:hypothetical protein